MNTQKEILERLEQRLKINEIFDKYHVTTLERDFFRYHLSISRIRTLIQFNPNYNMTRKEFIEHLLSEYNMNNIDDSNKKALLRTLKKDLEEQCTLSERNALDKYVWSHTAAHGTKISNNTSSEKSQLRFGIPNYEYAYCKFCFLIKRRNSKACDALLKLKSYFQDEIYELNPTYKELFSANNWVKLSDSYRLISCLLNEQKLATDYYQTNVDTAKSTFPWLLRILYDYVFYCTDKNNFNLSLAFSSLENIYYANAISHIVRKDIPTLWPFYFSKPNERTKYEDFFQDIQNQIFITNTDESNITLYDNYTQLVYILASQSSSASIFAYKKRSLWKIAMLTWDFWLYCRTYTGNCYIVKINDNFLDNYPILHHPYKNLCVTKDTINSDLKLVRKIKDVWGNPQEESDEFFYQYNFFLNDLLKEVNEPHSLASKKRQWMMIEAIKFYTQSKQVKNTYILSPENMEERFDDKMYQSTTKAFQKKFYDTLYLTEYPHDNNINKVIERRRTLLATFEETEYSPIPLTEVQPWKDIDFEDEEYANRIFNQELDFIIYMQHRYNIPTSEEILSSFEENLKNFLTY